MASLTTDKDNERFSDILVHNFDQDIQANRAERKKRKGSPPPKQGDDTAPQEQKRAKSPPPNVIARTPSFIQKAHDANASNPPTPVKPKEKKEEAAKARPKQPEAGKNLFGGDVPLAQLPPLPKRAESFDWDPDTERIGFDDIGDDPFGNYLPTITREEADAILEETDEKPSPVLDSFDFDKELGLLNAVSETDHQINEIIAALGDGLLTQEEADRELDEKRDKLKLAKKMADNELQSLKLYREKPCTVAKKSSVKKLTDRINIKF